MNFTAIAALNRIQMLPPAARLFEWAWYQSGRMGMEALRAMLFETDVIYRCPLPDGARMLCANHPTTIDPVMLTLLVPEQVSILISETLFKVPLLGPSLAAAGHVCVVQAAGRTALETGIRLIGEGRTVGIFPEGDISPSDGGLAKAHTGAARMALQTGAPVVPVGISVDPENVRRIRTVVDGREEVGTWYFHGPYAATVGEPLYFYGSAEDREQVRAVTRKIMERIRMLAQESRQRIEEKAKARPGASPASERPMLSI